MDPIQLSMIYRLLLAAVLGGILGFEREFTGKSAGLRTYALVSFGAALFTMIAPLDQSRIISQIVVGVGFIGAGLIIFQQAENRIHGLTTAAGLWVAAAIGCAVAAGFYAISIFSAIFILSILSSTRYLRLEERIHKLGERRNENIQQNK